MTLTKPKMEMYAEALERVAGVIASDGRCECDMHTLRRLAGEFRSAIKYFDELSKTKRDQSVSVGH